MKDHRAFTHEEKRRGGAIRAMTAARAPDGVFLPNLEPCHRCKKLVFRRDLFHVAHLNWCKHCFALRVPVADDAPF